MTTANKEGPYCDSVRCNAPADYKVEIVDSVTRTTRLPKYVCALHFDPHMVEAPNITVTKIGESK